VNPVEDTVELVARTIAAIVPVEKRWEEAAQERLDNLTKPRGSLGRLEELARRLVAVAGEALPAPGRKEIFVLAGDHGVTAEGVSAFPSAVTPQMVLNFLRGGAAINVLARHAGAEVVVVDIGVDHVFGATPGLLERKVMRGTGNIARGPAMTRGQAVRCLEVGIALAEDAAARGCRMVGTGEMGIGNTTPSSAIAAVLCGRPVAEVTGRGTGITDEALAAKVRVIEGAIALNRPDPADAIDVLARLGGTEIGGIAGLCLGAAARRMPVVVDGFISTAGALLAARLAPRAADYMFAAHASVERGHRALLEALGLRPILDLEMRLGEGTGGALAMGVIEAALKIYREMATFAEAGVSGESGG
jgi:nicotinate-nucleotide--dimethylbenzimidazole phosphoribosyltransferase